MSGSAAQDFCAVDGVALHDRELVIGQLVWLVQNLRRGFHLADVVHQGGESEFAQQRSLDAQAARLRHRQDRHVHHVREGVVVVLLQRRQRHQGGSVPDDGLSEAVDHRLGGSGIGQCVRSRALPHHACDRHGVRVHAANRGHVGAFLRRVLVECDATDADVRRFELRDRIFQRLAGIALFEESEHFGEARQLVDRDVAGNRDALDPQRAKAPNELAHRRARLAHRQIADDQLLAENPDDDRCVVLVERADGFGQRFQIPRNDRMAGCVQLNAPQPRPEAPEQIIGKLITRRRV